MNPLPGPHEPSPEFRAHLEWQVASALRREGRFAEPSGPSRPTWLRLAAMLIVAFALGSIVTIASSEVQDARQQQRLEEAVNAEVRLIQMRHQIAEQALAEARKRFDVGAGSREEMMEAELQLVAMEAAITKAKLDLEEIRLTAASPRNDLNAPLIGGRDFVRARIEADLESAERAVSMEAQVLTALKRRQSVGSATLSSRLQAEIELARAEEQLQTLRGKLELRARALKENMRAEQIATALRRMELTLTVDRVVREMEMTRGRIQELREMVKVGVASELELKRAEVRLLELETEAQAATRALDALGRKHE
jgi:outer membrane protein TolC